MNEKFHCRVEIEPCNLLILVFEAKLITFVFNFTISVADLVSGIYWRSGFLELIRAWKFFVLLVNACLNYVI